MKKQNKKGRNFHLLFAPLYTLFCFFWKQNCPTWEIFLDKTFLSLVKFVKHQVTRFYLNIQVDFYMFHQVRSHNLSGWILTFLMQTIKSHKLLKWKCYGYGYFICPILKYVLPKLLNLWIEPCYSNFAICPQPEPYNIQKLVKSINNQKLLILYSDASSGRVPIILKHFKILQNMYCI